MEMPSMVDRPFGCPLDNAPAELGMTDWAALDRLRCAGILKSETRGNTMAGAWSDELIESLKQKWNEGISASLIAEQLSTPEREITRNAVLGKVDRLNLPPRRTKTMLEGGRKRGEGDRKRERKVRVMRQIKEETVEFIKPPPEAKDFLCVGIFDLTPGMCRYPRGEVAPFLFCGQPAKDDSSYCEYCHWITHTEAKPKPRRKVYASSITGGWRAA